MRPDDLTIRPLASRDDYLACVALQQATWGEGFQELVPPAMLMIAEKMGGVAAGAFADRMLVGFVYGVTGVRDGRLSHWSHMLAVANTWRDRGVGRRLKGYQRDQLVALGIDHMLWTYDPLVARNAHLNLNRLGVTVREYARALYGDDPDSSTDSVIGSDRLVVEWTLTRVRREGANTDDAHTDQPSHGAADPPTDRPPRRATVVSVECPALPDTGTVEIAIPGDIQGLKHTAPDAARAWRLVTRRAFEHYLGRGYTVRRLRTAADRSRSYYFLELRT